ncbi:3-phosphoglycerate dehydrogenase [Alkalibaculum sp. M08DMB]|uniref:3-phosphoglycerate dehydrogenase n=1 Tax=Alkalibaculum sporogenes TaxID=2655001 RepID=A0A6A7K9G3_9FIRM|nr:hydroxyacid dehydrogenase [Alkalibaculum sporogenes]MPW26118.1 3-phosphoglycerate dehydrogenase [Alkalibaculum sporogenes]
MKVFLNEFIHPAAVKRLSEFATITEDLTDIKSVDAIILRTLKVDRKLMETAVNLKVIGKHGVGVNTIDVEAAKELGIKVVYTPTANTNSVAELTLALIMDIARNITMADRKSRDNQFDKIAPPELSGTEITGKTLGLIGMGNIAQRLSIIMKSGFGVKVIGYDPYVNHEKAKQLSISKKETVGEIIKEADIVNISVPLNKSTENLVSGELFNMFKKDAILVNAARGGVVNEDDLYNALRNKTLRAAACDAFVVEPPTNENKLLSLDNFVATPHIGANTIEALLRMGMDVVEDVKLVLHGNKAINEIC